MSSIGELVETLASQLLARGARLATAESCTGGLIAAACTDLAGSSAWFDRGYITYSNEAKTEMLGVSPELIAQHGAVSEPVARAMAEGALQQAGVDFAVAVTGVAGPGGGSALKPVGTVWLAWASREGPTRVQCHHFVGDRAQVRQQTCVVALQGLLA
jgi:nicotinamide-nucleotide amidase